jgi:cytoplasmic iron level regulating protein YaaA (DUF328/UPF0246 family)
MFIVLSPAKSLDSQTPLPIQKKSKPYFQQEPEALIKLARQLSPGQLMELMDISADLANLNVQRFQSWRADHHLGRPAIFTFNGDVYEGLDAYSLAPAKLDYLQTRLGILSGLYGMLKPYDLMQEYRLEMGTRLENPFGKNLYSYWGSKVTDLLNQILLKHRFDCVLNLASDEYFKVLQPAKLKARLIQPVFQDWKNGKYKIISFYAKRARGLMARYCAEHGISDPAQLQNFDVEGYQFAEQESDDRYWVYRRKLAD